MIAARPASRRQQRGTFAPRVAARADLSFILGRKTTESGGAGDLILRGTGPSVTRTDPSLHRRERPGPGWRARPTPRARQADPVEAATSGTPASTAARDLDQVIQSAGFFELARQILVLGGNSMEAMPPQAAGRLRTPRSKTAARAATFSSRPTAPSVGSEVSNDATGCNRLTYVKCPRPGSELSSEFVLAGERGCNTP